MRTIVFTGGGTLGHCLPSLSLLPYLNKAFDRFVYVGSKTGPEREAVKCIMEYMPITTTKLIRGFNVRNLTIPFKLITAVSEAKSILEIVRPSVVFSKGGFVSVPVAIAAKKLGIPLVVHESDLTLGLANRIAAKRADVVCTSFSSTCENLDNGIYTGPPIRDEIFVNKRFEAQKLFCLPLKKPVLLVMGGSQGAKSINDFLLSNLNEILKTYEVLHICGSGHTTNVNKVGYRQVAFLKDMALAYSISDICVSRCGSNSAFELLSRNIPTLFIPLPKGNSRGDQVENARYFQLKGVSKTLEEQNLRLDSFLENLNLLWKNKAEYSARMRALNLKDGAKEIAKTILDRAK